MPASYSIGPHFEAMVKVMVKDGRYASASDVVRDALRLLEDKEATRLAAIERIRTLWDEGINSGHGGVWDAEKFKKNFRTTREGLKSSDAA
jgi:antitoxin ParD1/3/4